MDSERFEQECATTADVDADESRAIFELTLDELSYVAGGVGSTGLSGGTVRH